ncbi:MAG: CHAT domain-containing tetratricopeptide repeat protein [Bacteroidota bacterium]
MKFGHQIQVHLYFPLLVIIFLSPDRGLSQVPPSQAIEQWLIEADSLRRLRQLTPALALVDKAMTAFDDQDTQSALLARAYLSQGRILLRTESCYRADVPLREALERYKQLDDPPNTYRAYKNLAELQVLLENYAEAIQLFYEASQFASKEWGQGSYQLGLIYMYMSTCYKYLGDFETSGQYIESAISILSSSLPSHDYRLAEAYFRAGGLYFGSGEYLRATEVYSQSYQAIRQDSGRRVGWIQDLHNNLGAAYWELGARKEALFHYQQAMKIEIKRNPQSVAEWEGELEGQKASQEELGMKYFLSTLEQRKRTYGSHHPGTAGCYLYIGNAYLSREEPLQALSSYQQAIGSLQEQLASLDIREHLHTFSPTNREELLLDALIGKVVGFDKLHEQTAELEYHKEAFLACKSASLFIQEIRRGRKKEASHIIWSQKVAPFFARAIDIAWNLYQHTDSLRYLNQAFEWTEEGRSFALLQTFRKGQALSFSGIPKRVLSREQAFKKQLAEYDSYILAEENKGSTAREEKINALVQGKLSLEGEYESFLRRLEQQYPHYYRLKYQISVCKIGEIQTYLSGQNRPKGWLTFVEGEQRMYGFLITPDTVIWKACGQLTQIGESADALHATLAGIQQDERFLNEEYQKFLVQASYVYEALIWPFEAVLPKRSIISPVGPISYLPFEVLLSERVKSEKRNYQDLPYLLKQYTLSYAYSGTFFLEQTARQSSQVSYFSSPYLGFAPSYGEARGEGKRDKSNLHYTQLEVEQSASQMNGKVFLDKEATKDHFLEYASHATVLHLAMHGQMNDSSPEYSHLSFYEDHRSSADPNLYVFELFGLRMGCDLAVLSACNTGTGKWIRGEGLMSMARGFSYAGCPSLIVSLWQVDDQATASIMTAFFRHLSKDQQKDKAIRSAQLEYLKQGDPLTTHPYFWAGWKMLGESSLQNSTYSSQNMGWVFGGLLILSLVVFTFYKRSNRTSA